MWLIAVLFICKFVYDIVSLWVTTMLAGKFYTDSAYIITIQTADMWPILQMKINKTTYRAASLSHC